MNTKGASSSLKWGKYGSFGKNLKGGPAIGAGVVAALGSGILEYMENKDNEEMSTGEKTGRILARGGLSGLGAWGGAAAGAAIGTAIFPGVGTLAGLGIGATAALLGAAGAYAGDRAGRVCSRGDRGR